MGVECVQKRTENKALMNSSVQCDGSGCARTKFDILGVDCPKVLYPGADGWEKAQAEKFAD